MTNGDAGLWEDLVVAILSVNNYSIEKTYSKIKEMRREKLFEPENLMRWSPVEIARRMKRAGYDRGQFMTSLFAERLSSLGKHLQGAGIEHCREVLAKGSTDAIKRLLLMIKGIGPKVLANFFILRGIES
jgi:endonuclease III-like uncharacterized protein